MTVHQPLVGIAMGSASDLPTLRPAAEILEHFGVAHEVRVLSAHRTPAAMAGYASDAVARGLKVLIAGAGAEVERRLRRLRKRGARSATG